MIRILTVSTFLALALLAGCSSTTNTRIDGPVTEQALPDWVLIVPVEEDGRSVFVGGCTMALSPAEGIEAAESDALLQITSKALSTFTDAFALSPRESGVTTTSIERLDFRELGSSRYAELMVAGAEVERSYLRSCTTGEAWESTGAPEDIGIDGAVCSVFVRVTCDADAWERNLSETLREMRQGFASSGRDHLAQLADWIDGRLPGLLGGDDARREEPDAGDR